MKEINNLVETRKNKQEYKENQQNQQNQHLHFAFPFAFFRAKMLFDTTLLVDS